MASWNRLKCSRCYFEGSCVTSNPRCGDSSLWEIPGITNSEFLVRTCSRCRRFRKSDFKQELSLFKNVLFHSIKLVKLLQRHCTQSTWTDEVNLCIQNHEGWSNVALIGRNAQCVLVWNDTAISTCAAICLVAPVNRTTPVFTLIVPETTSVKA